MAPAIGSSTMYTSRAPAVRAASRTARLSTFVTPVGTPTTTRGPKSFVEPACALWMRYVSNSCVTSKSEMTPCESGRMARICGGVLPSISFAPFPMATTCPVFSFTATADGSLMTMPRPRTYTSVFAGPQVDADVA